MSTDKELLLMIKPLHVGDGGPGLGETLMKSFLTMIWESGVLPSRIICIAAGVFLTTAGSAVADILGKFEKHGVEILSCGLAAVSSLPLFITLRKEYDASKVKAT